MARRGRSYISTTTDACTRPRACPPLDPSLTRKQGRWIRQPVRDEPGEYPKLFLTPKAGVAGAQPMRGEREGCPLATSTFLVRCAKQRVSDAKLHAPEHCARHGLCTSRRSRPTAIRGTRTWNSAQLMRDEPRKCPSPFCPKSRGSGGAAHARGARGVSPRTDSSSLINGAEQRESDAKLHAAETNHSPLGAQQHVPPRPPRQRLPRPEARATHLPRCEPSPGRERRSNLGRAFRTQRDRACQKLPLCCSPKSRGSRGAAHARGARGVSPRNLPLF